MRAMKVPRLELLGWLGLGIGLLLAGVVNYGLGAQQIGRAGDGRTKLRASGDGARTDYAAQIVDRHARILGIAEDPNKKKAEPLQKLDVIDRIKLVGIVAQDGELMAVFLLDPDGAQVTMLKKGQAVAENWAIEFIGSTSVVIVGPERTVKMSMFQ